MTSRWRDACDEILRRLDLLADAKKLGLRLVAAKATAGGWQPCQAVDRDDRHELQSSNERRAAR